MKRRYGHASVEEYPKGSGKYRVRARLGKKRPVLGKNLSRVAAEELANAQAAVRNAQELREGITLETFGIAFMARRADQGVRGVRKDELRWNKHIAAAPIGKLAVSSLLRSDIVEWRDQLQGSHRSKLKLLNLLRVALGEAVERGVLEANPAREVRLHRSGAARSTDDLEGILTPAEQVALMAAVPLRDRPCVVFALFTGLRLSEQWWLDWSDILDGAVVVSKSVGGDPAKSGKVREVPLLPNALEALEVQRSFGRKPPILFPGARGARRTDTKAPLKFASWVKAAGIKRHVTWHDLRHTCATSLLAGWWGRKWSLDEVCKMLGHSSIAVTERYARKLNETLRLAVSNTPGLLMENNNGPKSWINSEVRNRRGREGGGLHGAADRGAVRAAGTNEPARAPEMGEGAAGEGDGGTLAEGTSGQVITVVPPGARNGPTVGNHSSNSAFVKHRSRVQVSQSAPVVAARVLGPSCGQGGSHGAEENPSANQTGRGQGDAVGAGGAGRAGAHLAQAGRSESRVDSRDAQARPERAQRLASQSAEGGASGGVAPNHRHSGRFTPGWFGPTPPPSSPGDFAGLPQGWV